MEQFEDKPYTEEELQNIQKLVDVLARIDKELREEGIPIDLYERVLIHGEDPAVVFGTEN